MILLEYVLFAEFFKSDAIFRTSSLAILICKLFVVQKAQPGNFGFDK